MSSDSDFEPETSRRPVVSVRKLTAIGLTVVLIIGIASLGWVQAPRVVQRPGKNQSFVALMSSHNEHASIGSQQNADTIHNGDTITNNFNDGSKHRDYEKRVRAKSWYEAGLRGGTKTSDGLEYDRKMCLIQALHVDPTYVPAWVELGVLGGSLLHDKQYDAIECALEAMKFSKINIKGIHFEDGGCSSASDDDLKKAKVCPIFEVAYDHGGGDALVTALARALKSTPKLTSLDLGSNYFEEKGATALAEALKSTPELTSINLAFNDVRDEGVTALAEALKSTPKLTSLNLYDNYFGDKGVTALAEALKSTPKLTSLDLSSNKFGDKGVTALAEALESMPMLSDLDLALTSIHEGGATALAKALESGSIRSLKKLDLRWNYISKHGIEELVKAAKRGGLDVKIEF